ncbi:hypothetical protein VTH82DRAFT_979 [Thermothelomyces myriococcoides]
MRNLPTQCCSQAILRTNPKKTSLPTPAKVDELHTRVLEPNAVARGTAASTAADAEQDPMSGCTTDTWHRSQALGAEVIFRGALDHPFHDGLAT